MSRDPAPAHWACSGCGKSTREDPIDYYMLADALWKRIADDPRGMLCLSCAEKRIGRTIEKDDLKECPLNSNHPIFKDFYRRAS